MRTALFLTGLAIVTLYFFAQYVRRTSMFIPSRFPEGAWDTRSLAVQPEDVWFTTDDGVRLHGWLFAGKGPNLLLYCHGNAGNITDRATIAAQLARQGVSTLLFDWRGYGKSEGHPSETKLFRDALAAYDFARTRTRGYITIYGESLGGPYAAYVAAHRKVHSVVIENSFSSLTAVGNTLYRPLPLGWFVPGALRTADWLNAAGVPVLVMHGKPDEVIPFPLGIELYDDLRVPKELLVSERAGHCELANAEGSRYYEAVCRFATGN